MVTPFDTAVFVANMVLACLAAVVNARAAVHHPEMQERRRFQIIGMLAMLYVVGYLLVLSGVLPVLTWSSYFRGVSLLAWPLVWAWPAIVDTIRWKREREAARVLIDRARESRGERHDRRVGGGD